MEREKILVTSALPYANGPIHFGHIAGAYLPADVFVRFKKLQGADVIYISGTDEHGFAITVSAQVEGNTPQKHVDHYFDVISDTFDKFNIRFDNFSRTSKPAHHLLSQQFFSQLLDNKKIDKRDTQQLYCETDKMFLADRYVTGACPHCGFAEARGDECGSCGKWLEALELVEPKCKTCHSTPVKRNTTHWFLQLNDFEKQLTDWLATKPDWKPNVKNFINAMIKNGLEARPITRDMDWGVKVPLDEAKGKVLYVWFDAPIGYVSSTIEWAEKMGQPDLWKEYWENPKCKLIHFIGKDNLPFHCVVWPAMLMGQDEKFILPHDVPANEFYNLEGKQFSKSTGWYIDLDHFFEKYSADSIRYTIAANAPETKDSAFTWKDFQIKTNSELADILGNFINRTLKFTASTFENKVPENNTLNETDQAVLQDIQKSLTKLENCYSGYQLRNACFEMMELARIGNRYFDDQAPWKSKKNDMDRCAASLFVSLQIVKALALACFPVMPDTGEKIWKQLNLTSPLKDVDWNKEKQTLLNSGHLLGEAAVLFVKIENEMIDKEIKNLEDKVSA